MIKELQKKEDQMRRFSFCSRNVEEIVFVQSEKGEHLFCIDEFFKYKTEYLTNASCELMQYLKDETTYIFLEAKDVDINGEEHSFLVLLMNSENKKRIFEKLSRIELEHLVYCY